MTTVSATLGRTDAPVRPGVGGGVLSLIRRLRRAARRHPIVRARHFLSLQPASRKFGLDRGSPIDRHYIEQFLAARAADIRGRVLEIGDATYTCRFGGSRVAQSDVLHAAAGNPHATIVGDLVSGAGVAEGTFDCVILTQTLPFIFDVNAAVATAYRALRPGGVLLATLPGVSQISRYDMDRWGDFWRFTDLSARRLFGAAFGETNVQVESHGNAFVTACFLRGLAREDLHDHELAYTDRDYQLLITVRAVKAPAPGPAPGREAGQ